MEETNDAMFGVYHPFGKKIKLSKGDTYYQFIKSPNDVKDPVVLIHGITWWSFTFDPVIPVFLEQGHSVLTFDLYGRGQSESPSETNDLKFFVEQTRELLDLVLPQRKVIMSGLSLGGAIASGFVSLYPQYVSKAIIMCPAGLKVLLPDIVNFLSIPVIGWLGFRAVGKSTMIQMIRKERLAPNFYQFAKVEAAGIVQNLMISTIWQIEHKSGYLDSFHSTLCNFPWNDLSPYLEKIDPNIPVLLLWGDHDNICQGSDLFVKAVPQTQLCIMKNCGHAFLYEDLIQAADYIIPFLQ